MSHAIDIYVLPVLGALLLHAVLTLINTRLARKSLLKAGYHQVSLDGMRVIGWPYQLRYHDKPSSGSYADGFKLRLVRYSLDHGLHSDWRPVVKYAGERKIVPPALLEQMILDVATRSNKVYTIFDKEHRVPALAPTAD